MKDLRIVIVSWNVEKLLESCLKSLPNACRGLEWDCVVVDNASQDGSANVARRMAQDESRIFLIANTENVGFGKACNQGARGGDERYLLFLNPDTYCHPESIARFVRLADERPRAGILGPKLTNPDGSTQKSMRRFPTVWNQAGTLLKLQRVIPWAFRNYLATDLSQEKEQAVDQVMGACFLVRRECWEDVGPFDERFFIWFEEVDRCKAAVEKGWEIRYLPQVSIVHHGGESFAQVMKPKKQRYYNDSLINYFEKWQPGWRVALLRFVAPIAMAEAWIIEKMRNQYVRWSVIVLALEITSTLTIFHPLANSVATIALGLCVFFLAWKKPTTALGLLTLELLIGSKGGLLQFGSINGRVIFTGAFFIGWILNVWKKRSPRDFVEILFSRKATLALFVLIIFATIRGVVLGNADVLHDANAWFYLVMLFPVVDIARRESGIAHRLVPIFFVGVFWLAAETLILEILFSRGFATLASPVYLWIRRTGVGEITPIVDGAFRVFLQSQIYAVAGWLIAFGFWMKERSRIAFAVMAAAAFTLFASLSRSFWIGTAVGSLALIALYRTHWKRLLGPIAAAVIGVAIFAAVTPVPITDLFIGRTTVSDPAASSRWVLLPKLVEKIKEEPILGSGFGAIATYATKDPRVLATRPDGLYTTYAFEWGWLDHWIKFGILGIPVMLWVLASLGWRLWKSATSHELRATSVACLLALAVVHVFTPYLNHPLGFLFLLAGEGLLAMNVREHTPTRT